MNSTTCFERDILRQPLELDRTLTLLTGALQDQLRQAAILVRQSKHVFLTGIGASWHVAMGAGALFNQQGRQVCLLEAAELLHFASIPPGAVVIALSRTGRSIEIIQLASKIQDAGARLVGITNSPDSPLANESAVALVLPIALDHAISVTHVERGDFSFGLARSSWGLLLSRPWPKPGERLRIAVAMGGRRQNPGDGDDDQLIPTWTARDCDSWNALLHVDRFGDHAGARSFGCERSAETRRHGRANRTTPPRGLI